jgi:hypothetical protein
MPPAPVPSPALRRHVRVDIHNNDDPDGHLTLADLSTPASTSCSRYECDGRAHRLAAEGEGRWRDAGFPGIQTEFA